MSTSEYSFANPKIQRSHTIDWTGLRKASINTEISYGIGYGEKKKLFSWKKKKDKNELAPKLIGSKLT